MGGKYRAFVFIHSTNVLTESVSPGATYDGPSCNTRQLAKKKSLGKKKKALFFVYGPSSVKSQKFLPAVNHTKLRIPMLSMVTTELMEESKCTQ